MSLTAYVQHGEERNSNMTFLQILSRTTVYQTIELHVYNKELDKYDHYVDTVYNFLVDKEDKYIGLCEYLVTLILIENNILRLTIREA